MYDFWLQCQATKYCEPALRNGFVHNPYPKVVLALQIWEEILTVAYGVGVV